MEIGLIGTGLMGLPMAQRLLATGESLIVYNRTAEKLEPLRQEGAAIAPSAAQLLQRVDCVILMLTDAAAIRSLLFAPEVKPYLAGRTMIQMGTIAPEESRAIAQEITQVGGDYLEAPVLGSISEARNGKLIVMVGGTAEQFETYQELLQVFGPEPILIGPVGTASAVKLALNQLIAALTTAFSLSLGLVQQQGADVESFMKILRGSALYAPTFDKKLQRMLERNYANPNFPTKHLLKDTTLFLETAQPLRLDISSVAAIQQVLTKAMAMGLAEADYASLFSAVNPL